MTTRINRSTTLTKYAMELLRDHGIKGVKAAGVRFKMMSPRYCRNGVRFRIEVVTENGVALAYINSPELLDGESFTIFEIDKMFVMHLDCAASHDR